MHIIYTYVLCTSIVGVLAVAAGVMAIHYELLVELHDACPLPMLVGESETGKYSGCVVFVCAVSTHVIKWYINI